MVNLRLIEDSFDTGNCQNYILSVQCSLNGYSFLIYDTISNKFIAHLEKEMVMASPFEVKVEFDKLMKAEAILSQAYKRVVVSYLTLHTMLVPQSLCGEEDAETLMETAFGKGSDEVILSNELPIGKSKLLFSFPGALYRDMKEKHNPVRFISPAMPIIKYGLKDTRTPLTLHISRFHDILLVLMIKEKKIHFLNQFYVKNDTDCLYFILSVARQLSLDQTTEINLMGRINQRSVLVSSLKNYFEKVGFVAADDRCSQVIVTDAGQSHFIIPQTELTLCE